MAMKFRVRIFHKGPVKWLTDKPAYFLNDDTGSLESTLMDKESLPDIVQNLPWDMVSLLQIETYEE